MRKSRRLAALVSVPVVASYFLCGCTTLVGSFTAVSSKDVNVSSIKLTHSMMKGHGVGEDCTDIIGFIPDKGPPNMKEAMDRALESKKGTLLLNARIEQTSYYIPLIFGQNCYTVEGDVYDTFQ
jgi:hypothetical protein